MKAKIDSRSMPGGVLQVNILDSDDVRVKLGENIEIWMEFANMPNSVVLEGTRHLIKNLDIQNVEEYILFDFQYKLECPNCKHYPFEMTEMVILGLPCQNCGIALKIDAMSKPNDSVAGIGTMVPITRVKKIELT